MRLGKLFLILLVGIGGGLVGCGRAGDESTTSQAFGDRFPWVVATQAGDYRHFQYDKGDLQRKYLAEVFANRRQDFDYYVSSLETIEREFKTFVASLYAPGSLEGGNGIPGLVAFSDDAKINGKFHDANLFKKAVNKYMQDRLALETTINTLTSVSRGSLPSYQTDQLGGADLPPLPGKAQVAFDEVRKWYAGRLAEIQEMVSNLPQNLIVRGIEKPIQENTGKSLAIPDPSVRITGPKLDEMKARIRTLRQWNYRQQTAMTSFSIYTKQVINTFVTEYGWKESYTWPGENILASMREQLESIEKIMFARTYFRFAYGMPMGAITMPWQERAFGTDRFFNSTRAIRFGEQIAFGMTDLIEVKKDYIRILDRLETRSSEIFNGDLGVLGNIENVLTVASGHRNAAVALNMVAKLLAADAYEEMLITDVGGLAKIGARYRARYMRDKETYQHFLKYRAELDPRSLSDKEKAFVQANFRDIVLGGGTATGGLTQEFSVAVDMGQGKFRDLQEAQELDDAIEASNLYNNTFFQQQRDRLSAPDDFLN